MKAGDEWWTSPTESGNGRLVIVTGRDGVDALRLSGKYRYRVELTWRYPCGDDGMPSREESELMEQADEALKTTFRKEHKAGVITGIYTGDGQRDWVIYTPSLKLFGSVLNRALSALPQLPLEISAEEDPQWEEYEMMRENSYIAPEDD